MAAKKSKSEGTEGATDTARRISIDLAAEVTTQIEEYAAAHPLIHKSAIRELVRGAAATAAFDAVNGRVEEIVKAAL